MAQYLRHSIYYFCASSDVTGLEETQVEGGSNGNFEHNLLQRQISDSSSEALLARQKKSSNCSKLPRMTQLARGSRKRVISFSPSGRTRHRSGVLGLARLSSPTYRSR